MRFILIAAVVICACTGAFAENSTMKGISVRYAQRETPGQWWVCLNQKPANSGWSGMSVEFTPQFFGRFVGSAGKVEDRPDSKDLADFRTEDHMHSGASVLWNVAYKAGKASVVLGAGAMLDIYNQKKVSNVSGRHWGDEIKYRSMPVAHLSVLVPVTPDRDVELGYSTSGTAFVSLVTYSK